MKFDSECDIIQTVIDKNRGNFRQKEFISIFSF